MVSQSLYSEDPPPPPSSNPMPMSPGGLRHVSAPSQVLRREFVLGLFGLRVYFEKAELIPRALNLNPGISSLLSILSGDLLNAVFRAQTLRCTYCLIGCTCKERTKFYANRATDKPSYAAARSNVRRLWQLHCLRSRSTKGRDPSSHHRLFQLSGMYYLPGGGIINMETRIPLGSAV